MDLEVFVRADDYEEDYLFDLVMKMFDKNAILNVGFEDKYATFSIDDRTLGSVKVETELDRINNGVLDDHELGRKLINGIPDRCIF